MLKPKWVQEPKRFVGFFAASLLLVGASFWLGYEMGVPAYCCVHPLAQHVDWLTILSALSGPFAGVAAVIVAVRGEAKADRRQEEEWRRRRVEHDAASREQSQNIIRAIRGELYWIGLTMHGLGADILAELDPDDPNAVGAEEFFARWRNAGVQRPVIEKLDAAMMILPLGAIKIIVGWEMRFPELKQNWLEALAQLPNDFVNALSRVEECTQAIQFWAEGYRFDLATFDYEWSGPDF